MFSRPMSIVIALLLLVCTCAGQGTPPDLSPDTWRASGDIGLGQQPFQTGVPIYNGSFEYQAYPGGSQQAIYYDAEIPIPTVTGMYAQIVNITACGFSLPHYHPDIVELNYVLEGEGLIAGLMLQSDATGTIPTWATGLAPGGVATVTANSIHYAENPGCGTASLLQVFAGLPDNYDYLPYVDLPGALLAQDATAVQFAFGLTNEQLQNAVKSVRPLFAVNQTCLAICNGAAPGSAPASSASGR